MNLVTFRLYFLYVGVPNLYDTNKKYQNTGHNRKEGKDQELIPHLTQDTIVH